MRLAAAVFVAAVAAAAATRLQVDLHAPWMSSPHFPLQESSEFLAEEPDPSTFWSFVDAVAASVDVAFSESGDGAEQLLLPVPTAGEWALDTAELLLSPTSFKVLRAAVESRALSAAVQSQHQLSAAVTPDGCGSAPLLAWATVSDAEQLRVACSPDALDAVLDGAAGEAVPHNAVAGAVHPFDHVHPNSTDTGATVTVYGVLGTAAHAAFHTAVLGRLRAGLPLVYVHRHTNGFGAALPQSTTKLQGFGVGLDIKNMEYKALDDRAPDSAGAGADTDDGTHSSEDGEDADADDDDDDVDGLLFNTLLSRRPDKADELAALKARLIEDASAQGGLNVWDMVDLGFQATAHVMGVDDDDRDGGHDPLTRLTVMTGAFPSVAKWVSRLPVADALKDEATLNSQYGSQVGNVLLVNGLRVDVTSPAFNFFTLLNTVRKEMHLQSLAAELPIAATAVADMQQAALDDASSAGDGGAGADATPYRIDIRPLAKRAIFWLNNIEKDARYKKLPKSVQALLMPSYQLPAVRKNLFSVVLVADPTQPETIMALHVLLYYLDNNVPIRFGLVFTSEALVDGDASTAAPAPRGQATAAHVGQLLSTATRNHQRAGGVAFLRQLVKTWQEKMQDHQQSGAPGAHPDALTIGDVMQVYATAIQEHTGAWSSGDAVDEATAALNSPDDAVLGDVRASTKFARHHGMPIGSYTLNGMLVPSLDIQSTLMSTVYQDIAVLQRLVQQRKLTDSSNVLRRLLKGPRVVDRHHPVILAPRAEHLFVPLVGATADAVFANGFMHAPGSQTAVKPVSLVLLHDLSSRDGLHALTAALQLVTATGDDKAAASDAVTSAATRTRLSVWHVPVSSRSSTATIDVGEALVRLWPFLAPLDNGATVMSALLPVLYGFGTDPDDAELLPILHDALAGVPDDVRTATLAALTADAATWRDAYARTLHGVRRRVTAAAPGCLVETHDPPPADAAGTLAAVPKPRVTGCVMANGRVLPMAVDASWDTSDLAMLVHAEADARGKSAAAALGVATDTAWTGRSSTPLAQDDPSADWTSGVVAQVASLFALYQEAGARTTLPLHAMAHRHTMFATGPSDTALRVTAMLDPVSDAAQRTAPLLMFLRDALGAHVKVLLLPKADLSELPVKSFYRFVGPGAQPLVATPGAATGADAAITSRFHGDAAAVAAFAGLPRTQILTLKMYPPEPLNVQAQVAPYDLDNLRLDTPGMPRTVTAQFVVRSVLVGGQCDDLTNNQPPNGLQLVLDDAITGEAATDTLVMQNLGYFQLKANPGVWNLRLAAGRASDLYDVVSVPDSRPDGGLMFLGRRTSAGSGDAEVVETHRQVVVRDFTGPITQLRVRKKPGMEKLELLERPNAEDAEEQKGLWAQFRSYMSSGSASSGSAADGDADKDTVHVFSLASGHLYERFMKIMMLSVTKRTSSHVKFWLVENFLSPQFKDFIPHMAAEYGFDFELVTYKWPNWLRQQTEKQRIIWGYKILFLDVLFPLNLDKVIYVDADQVLRADIRELWDMDLHGAPYAYTPFCTSREETLGFQFWQQGYWKDHLQGKPYHISALYVVDLAVFRRQAYGDQLRAIYDQLSRDPNSLANLDQDLPNYAQHMVPIFSLPQSWLWCESWCSDESKADAKTIDLCNNPLHKEPKLDMARRVVQGDLFPETWVQLDTEVAAVERKVRERLAASDAGTRSAAAVGSSHQGHAHADGEL